MQANMPRAQMDVQFKPNNRGLLTAKLGLYRSCQVPHPFEIGTGRVQRQ